MFHHTGMQSGLVGGLGGLGTGGFGTTGLIGGQIKPMLASGLGGLGMGTGVTGLGGQSNLTLYSML